MTPEVGNGGTTGSVDVTPGPHTVGEIAGVGTDPNDYTDTIGGDCNADGTIILEEGDNAVCTITNTLKIPATITLKKALTQDNTDEANHVGLDEFHMFVTNVDDPGNPIEITMENQQIDAGTYTLSETGPPGFDFVLVSGDTGCPTMVEDMEQFTLESGDDLTCVIFNDDDADASSGQGVAFGFNGLQFTNTGPELGGMDSCVTTTNVPPCVEKQGALTVIVDPLLANPDSSIILWSLTPPGGSSTQVNNCALAGAYPASFDNSINGFGLLCSTFVPGTWNINYAFINT